ncbi:MAG: hypothetical protein QMD85_05720 [Candidatus Aenigmarchaeota archaeon]|nr:hypothetical protein [Candidatus Aenigmarchaeota archaeon]
MRESELVVYDQKPLRAADVRAQVNLIQEVMKSVMQKGQHYGVIPGAGDKPTLFKAGAEKIMTVFRLAADPEVKDLSLHDVMRYRVTCRLLAQSTGSLVGAGVGEASSDEEKYKWRYAVSEAEWNATPEDRRRIKYKRDGQINQVRINPADVANTVLKMAKKRALVDAVLTVTAASDIFTQGIEDLPEEMLNGNNPKLPIAPPQEKEPSPQGNKITKKQQGRFYAIAKSTGAPEEAIKKWLKEKYGFEHSADITTDTYEDVCERVLKDLMAEPGSAG